jgi:hypothetical protein
MEQTLDLTRLLIKQRKRNYNSWLVYFVTVVLFFIVGSLAKADDSLHLKVGIAGLYVASPCAPQISEANRRAMVEYNGNTGYWFHSDVGKCMLQRLAVLPILEERLLLYEERIEKSDDLVKLHVQMLNLSNGAREEAEGALESAIREKRRAEEQLNHWTRSPWLWFSVGTVTGIIVVIVSSYVVSAAVAQ